MTFSITAQDLFKLASLAAGEFGENADEALAILRRAEPEDARMPDVDDYAASLPTDGKELAVKPAKPE